MAGVIIDRWLVGNLCFHATVKVCCTQVDGTR